MTNEQIIARCQNCGGLRKEHGKRKPWKCPTRLAETYWKPWTVAAYEAAAAEAKRRAAK